MSRVLLAIAYLILIIQLPALSFAQSDQGSLCIVPNSEEPPTRFSPGQNYNPATLVIKIDKRKAVPWPHKNSLKINGLNLSERHLFVVISDGKPLQSFWFRFAHYKSAELCASFDGYQGVQLGEKWCRCK
jgi:hypothetical protein